MMWFYDYQKGERGDWQPQSQSTHVSISQEHGAPKVILQTFSSDSKYLAVADDVRCVTLFKNDHKFGDPSQPKEWFYSGKIKAQLGDITSLSFGKSLSEDGTERLRLFSIGTDKTLLEYDVHSSNQEGLKLISRFQIEQEHNPTACIWYPVNNYKEDILLTVNEEYKIKLWNASNTNQKCNIFLKNETFLFISQSQREHAWAQLMVDLSTSSLSSTKMTVEINTWHTALLRK